MRYSMQIDNRFMVLIDALGEKLCRCPLQTVIYENCQHKAILMVARHAKWRLGHPCETESREYRTPGNCRMCPDRNVSNYFTIFPPWLANFVIEVACHDSAYRSGSGTSRY